VERIGYRLVVAYDGTDYCGWQKQEPPADEFGDGGVEGSKGEVVGRVVKDGVERVQLRTVQHVLERAVRDALREEVVLTGASRTDSGVHAWGQSAFFVSEPMGEKGVGWPADRGVEKLVKAVNGRLPRDVWVRSAEVVGEDFNAIGGATSKEYTYTMACGEARPIFGRRYVWHTWYDLDVAKMNEAAKVLIGEHDFAGFAQINHGRKTTVREIFDCSVEELDGGNDVVGIGGDGVKLVRVRVSGSGFLYNMVRIVAGTLVEVGRGKMSVDDVRRVVAEADRLSNRGMTLPPMGLRLEWIRYGG
jgi:tRNA pseudouridine38-40 synthase